MNSNTVLWRNTIIMTGWGALNPRIDRQAADAFKGAVVLLLPNVAALTG